MDPFRLADRFARPGFWHATGTARKEPDVQVRTSPELSSPRGRFSLSEPEDGSCHSFLGTAETGVARESTVRRSSRAPSGANRVGQRLEPYRTRTLVNGGSWRRELGHSGERGCGLRSTRVQLKLRRKWMVRCTSVYPRALWAPSDAELSTQVSEAISVQPCERAQSSALRTSPAPTP